MSIGATCNRSLITNAYLECNYNEPADNHAWKDRKDPIEQNHIQPERGSQGQRNKWEKSKWWSLHMLSHSQVRRKAKTHLDEAVLFAIASSGFGRVSGTITRSVRTAMVSASWVTEEGRPWMGEGCHWTEERRHWTNEGCQWTNERWRDEDVERRWCHSIWKSE